MSSNIHEGENLKLESACQAAENALLDQRLFMLEDADFDEFNKLLDAPVKVNPGLKALLAKRAPWEK